MIGQTVGGYKIVSRLGAGGMGEVYIAEHTRIERRVAIKVLLPELSIRTEMVGRFFAEARATSSIRHPGIVEVFDCDVQPGGRAFIVMELLEGESLMARLERDRGFGHDERVALGVAADIADAVGAAHRKNIVHRDLKPDNVFLATDPRAPTGFVVKILDFGIAKLLVADTRSGALAARTQTGAILGTPIYMSPEQCRGASAVDCRADIYSLGCILFEMLAERPPFVYEGFGELIAAHIGERPLPLRGLRLQISPAAEALVARLLEKDPARRPQTMEEVHQEISSVLETAAGSRRPGAPGAAAERMAAMTRPMTGAGRTQVAGQPFAGRPSQTTFSAAAAEEMTLPPRAGRGKLWGALAAFGVLGSAVAALSYHRAAPRPADTAAAEAPPSPAAAPSPTVSVEVSDAPAGLTATVDGQAASLPLALPAGSGEHQVVFHAPGYRDRTLRVDGRASRILTLAMQAQEPASQPAAQRPPVAAAPPRPAAAPAEKRSHETTPATHHRRPAQPAPLDLEDDARKL